MKIISRRKVSDLLHHVIDGYTASHKGIIQLKDDCLIDILEFEILVNKNVRRLEDRIAAWRLSEKILCITFALVFCGIQVLDLRDDITRKLRRRGKYIVEIDMISPNE